MPAAFPQSIPPTLPSNRFSCGSAGYTGARTGPSSCPSRHHPDDRRKDPMLKSSILALALALALTVLGPGVRAQDTSSSPAPPTAGAQQPLPSLGTQPSVAQPPLQQGTTPATQEQPVTAPDSPAPMDPAVPNGPRPDATQP